jgi:3-phosphoshikimate 1-carboxyvinyltransferase
MALPDLIEIVPLAAPVHAEITVPGSKSITNRALILAALADGETILKGALWSEDTQIMVECLQELGFMVNVETDPAESCNRTITVYGNGGAVPRGGTEAQPLDLFVGNAGTAARFLAPFLCLGSGVYRLHGVPRMHERPQAALFSALRELGYRVESERGNDKLPVKICGKAESGKRKAETKCRVSIEESSQFASALLLSSKVGGWEIEIVGENADESPYVAMTTKLIEAFPKGGGTFQIEPDASSGSYFWGLNDWKFISSLLTMDSDLNNPTELNKWNVQVRAWPSSGQQIDANFPKTLKILSVLQLPTRSDITPENRTVIVSRIGTFGDTNPVLGDSIMTAITVSPIFTTIVVTFMHLARLRVQECERVVALRTELTKCGAKVVEEGDTLTVYPAKPGELHGAEIETYNDHRMAMCFAILGLKVPGIKIINPACVKKTFPNFFQKLAALPPHGLGAEIWEIKDGRRTRRLSGEDLFAD